MNNRSQNTRASGSRSRARAGSVARGSTSRSAYGRSSGHGEGTSGDGPTNNHKWTPRTTRILLELIITELEAEDYTIRLPSGPGKKRIEEKFHEMTGESVKWKPEMKSRIDYLRRLWQHNNILSRRTGVDVDQTTGKINMLPSWWEDRCAEVAPCNRKYIMVLQNNPLPFKDLLDRIYGEHDVEQDDHYSPYMLGVQFQHTENEETNNDDIHLAGTDEYGRTSYPSVNLNLSASDEEEPIISRSPVRYSREASRHSPYTSRRSSAGVRSTSSTRRAHTRRSNFEAQIDGRFQRMEESRGQLLEVVRSRSNTKPTYGDALAVLESLPIEPMNTFWWEANKLLMNDEDIRDGFMKLKSEENKIRHLERLSGVDRYGNPCELVNLRVASSTSGSGHVRSDGSAYGSRGSFGGESGGGGSVGGGSTGGGSVGGGSIGGGSVGDHGFSLNDINEDDGDDIGNILPSQASRGFNSQTSHNFGSFNSGSVDMNPHRFPGSSSGNFPEMFNFFNKSRGNDG